jgi:hypothetical protein
LTKGIIGKKDTRRYRIFTTGKKTASKDEKQGILFAFRVASNSLFPFSNHHHHLQVSQTFSFEKRR